MLHSEWKLIYLLLFFLFLPFCQPIEYYELTTEQSTGILSTEKNYPRAQELPSRAGEDNFANPFTSSQLDLVFVLDTSPNMGNFYTENLFGVDFLDRFKDYDWKFAYTNMSVSTLKKNPKKDQPVEDNSCANSSWTLLGIGSLLSMFSGGVAGPILLTSGITTGAKCGSKKKRIDENNLANGAFLPFEYNGKEFKSKGIYQLTKNVRNYNQIFDHSLRNGNKKNHSEDCSPRWKCDRRFFSGSLYYDAPETIHNEVHPLISTFISLEKGNQSVVVEENKLESFFRKDSLIVYVLVTIHDVDASAELSANQFQSYVEKAFGHENRVKLIPVTLGPKSNPICNVNVDAITVLLRLNKFAKELGNNPIDICSQSLADELFLEIEKSLYKKDVLNQ